MNERTATPPPLANLSGVPNPALVVDAGVARRNNLRAVAALGPGQILRPHFKAHKTIALAHLQLENGAPSVCCQTSWEAVALAEAGIGDIMVTNQIVYAAALYPSLWLYENGSVTEHPVDGRMPAGRASRRGTV